MRDFEDYCWRDLVSDEMRAIYSAYVRERKLGPQPALIVVHPGESAGDAAWQPAASRLLQEARRRAMPVIHSVSPDSTPVEVLYSKSEAVCARPCESAFFSSDLERRLKVHGARALVVCGAPTSGALRATAVEGKSYGYKVAMAEETVGDESDFLHKMALFDVAHKYADVMSLEELLAQL
jgi:nicotinamidase-related amidase